MTGTAFPIHRSIFALAAFGWLLTLLPSVRAWAPIETAHNFWFNSGIDDWLYQWFNIFGTLFWFTILGFGPLLFLWMVPYAIWGIWKMLVAGAEQVLKMHYD